MAGNTHKIDGTPWRSLAASIFACGFLGLYFTEKINSSVTLAVIGAAVLLCACVFSAVHHAEVLALKVGEPYGSIILALAVTVIEAALIISQMSSGQAGAEVIGRDTVYSAILIVINGVVGLCLIVGGMRHHEQVFKLDGATAALSVLATLATLALILPNYTISVVGPSYSATQLAFVGVVSLVLYGVFVFVQTVRHRDYFILSDANVETSSAEIKPSKRTTIINLVLLPVTLVLVVALAKFLSGPIFSMVVAAGLPAAFVGVIIALLVLLPEGIAAVRAAALDNVQTSLNLALGSAIATIGLTIPALAFYSIWRGQNLIIGVSPIATALLALSIFVGSVTLATGRTTILQGAVHLVIFAVFLFLSAVP